MEGGCIRCPFHAWKFSGAGDCVEVPYATRLPKRAPLRSHRVVERNGTLIMVDDDRMPLNPGEVAMMRKVRFRTLGCYPLTGAVV